MLNHSVLPGFHSARSWELRPVFRFPKPGDELPEGLFRPGPQMGQFTTRKSGPEVAKWASSVSPRRKPPAACAGPSVVPGSTRGWPRVRELHLVSDGSRLIPGINLLRLPAGRESPVGEARRRRPRPGVEGAGSSGWKLVRHGRRVRIFPCVVRGSQPTGSIFPLCTERSSASQISTALRASRAVTTVGGWPARMASSMCFNSPT
jgi:hypothetical protein